jgi:DNA-binding MurR/RpiR family transcriptional regulator
MIQPSDDHPLLKRIFDRKDSMTPRNRALAEFILRNPRKVVFMRTKELAAECETSESTVVRFVFNLGYQGYSDFIQALRDFVDTELTLLDRVELTSTGGPDKERFRKIVFEEVDNLKQLYETIDWETTGQVVDCLEKSARIYVVGSRLSYTLAYYMGWSLMKIRPDVQIVKGSDSTAIDWLTVAPPESAVVVIATTRYPNELIRIARLVRRLGLTLIVIADGPICPLIPFAHLSLVAPPRHIPLVGSPGTLSCLINYFTIELANRSGTSFRDHQERLEQSFRENDILFNLDKMGEY